MSERLSRDERRAQTRERLLDAAAQVFAERGFERASVDDVAEAAGYTKGAVYSNFASKTDLLIALLGRRIESQSARYSQRFEGQDLVEMTRAMQAPPGPMPESEKEFLVLAVEFWLHGMRDERARLLIAEQYERARTEVGDFLVASGYEKAGTASQLEPRDMAIVIEALGTGLALQAAIDPEHVRLGLMSDVLVALITPRPPHHAPALPAGKSGAPVPG